MATKYTLYFSDTSKTPFEIQAYTTNGPLSPSDAGIMVGASTANTTLQLYGKGLKDYGEDVFQDMVYMLENFANSTRPVFSVEGQLWYNKNVLGSPVATPELLIRNTTGNGDDVANDWDAVILATGSSQMMGELLLQDSTFPTSDYGAVPKIMLDGHTTDMGIHLSTAQNTFLDGLTLVGSPLSLQSADVNQLIGITGNVQTLLDAKLSLTGGTLIANANITFTGAPGGEVLGLPAVPSVDGAAASKKYVDDQLASGVGGDGVLTQVDWSSTATGSPIPAIVVSENVLQLTVTNPDTSTIVIEANGVSRVGHAHTATETPIDNSFNFSYGANVQTALEYIDTQLGSTSIPSATITVQRIFESLAAPITSPTPWQTQGHFADDNRLTITINGVKQYTHTRGTQSIIYDVPVFDGQYTGLDSSLIYDFDIAIDGGAATTITVGGGSPLEDISTHAALVTAINNQLTIGSPDLGATFSISGGGEIFTTTTSGSTSTISITDPGGSPLSSTYLFDVDGAPSAIIAATFLSNPVAAGSPAAIPDDITIAGDVTASFPVGKTFTIRGSVDATYGSYDGMYSVHIDGAVFGGVNTVIPIAAVYNSATNVPLLPLYNPLGSPTPAAPAPAPFGDVHLSPLGGIVQVNAGIAGIDGDYMETDSLGAPVISSAVTDYVVFNYNILTGSKIESLLYV